MGIFSSGSLRNVRSPDSGELALNSILVIPPDTGHHLMYEQPEVYLETVLSFLAGELDG